MPGDPYVCIPGGGKGATRRRGRAIAALAAEQHGVVSRAQLLRLGAGAKAIDGWIASGRLVVVHRGVYAVGHRLLTVEGRWMAGVLAGGPGAVLTHRSAADLWGLTGLRRQRAEVTVVGRRRPRRGILFHESPLLADEITDRNGIPVTTVARTLLDLAAVVSRVRLEQALSIAEARGLADSPSLPDLIARDPRRRGIANLRVILGDRRLGLDIARSELEIRFLEFLDQRGLPRPEVNAIVETGGRRLVVDCLWRSAGLVVELDSRRHHGHDDAFEADRARDLALVSAGLRTARVTWRRLHLEPDALEAELRAALGRGAG